MVTLKGRWGGGGGGAFLPLVSLSRLTEVKQAYYRAYDIFLL